MYGDSRELILRHPQPFEAICISVSVRFGAFYYVCAAKCSFEPPSRHFR